MSIQGNRERREITRRRFLGWAGVGAGGLAVAANGFSPGGALATPFFADYPFTLGVASGDPLPDGVVLWTRLAPEPLAQDGSGGLAPETYGVRFEVAEDEGFSRVVRRGATEAGPDLAHSVHVEVEGLRPGREYFYRFKAGPETSPVGRTKTAPAPGAPVGELALAFASCQNYITGFYAAYRDMARQDLDLVVHLGDYIYADAGGGRDDPDAVRFHSGPRATTPGDVGRARGAKELIRTPATIGRRALRPEELGADLRGGGRRAGREGGVGGDAPTSARVPLPGSAARLRLLHIERSFDQQDRAPMSTKALLPGMVNRWRRAGDRRRPENSEVTR